MQKNDDDLLSYTPNKIFIHYICDDETVDDVPFYADNKAHVCL